MLNDEIKTRLEEKVSLNEGTSTLMGDIWKQHRAAHSDVYHAAGRLHTFLSSRIHGHGLSHEYIAANPNSHKDVFGAIHNHNASMTMSEKSELGDHINALKDAQHRRSKAEAAHSDHPSFHPSVGSAIMHGVFGKKGTNLSDSLKAKHDDSFNAMEHHSMLDENSREAHKLRKKYNAEYDTSKQPAATTTKASVVDDDDDDNNVLKAGARSIGNSVLNALADTIRKPKDTPVRRKRKP